MSRWKKRQRGDESRKVKSRKKDGVSAGQGAVTSTEYGVRKYGVLCTENIRERERGERDKNG